MLLLVLCIFSVLVWMWFSGLMMVSRCLGSVIGGILCILLVSVFSYCLETWFVVLIFLWMFCFVFCSYILVSISSRLVMRFVKMRLMWVCRLSNWFLVGVLW